MPKAIIRYAEIGDGLAQAPNLRTADKREMIAATGEVGPSSLENGIRECDECWCLELEGDPIALYGYKESGDGSAFIWLMGSDRITDVQWQFLRGSKNTIKQVTKKFDKLWSLSDVRNTKHQEWYEWLGFKVIKEIKAGPFDLSFNLIELQKENANV